MEINIGIIDYGMGNLHSVTQAIRRLDQNIDLIKSPNQLDTINALILPGVGAFDPAMENLSKTDLIPDIKSWVKQGKPLLGICLGLQLLFESSEEGNSKGLGILKGQVKKLPKEAKERIPHMGWSPLNIKKSCPLINTGSKNSWMYFVHSFAAVPSINDELIATTKFGNSNVTAIVWKENIGACQFHPEKSGNSGKMLLQNWIKWLKTK